MMFIRYIIHTFLNKIRHHKSIVNGGLFSIYSFINQGISFMLLIILAKFILPEDYGRLSLFNTIVTLVSYFMAFSTSGYLSVSFFKSDFSEFKLDFTSIFILAFFSSTFLFIIVLFIYIFPIFDLGFQSYLLWLIVLLSFFQCIINLYLDYFRIQENIVSYGFVSCGIAILNFILSLLFVVTLNQGWLGRVQAQTICCISFFSLALYNFKRLSLFDFGISRKRLTKVLFWGIPLIPHHASVWLRQGMDRYFINFYHSVYDVGLFSFALNLTSIIIMIGLAFNNANAVEIYKILSDKEIPILEKKRKLMKQTMVIFIIYITVTVLITCLLYLLVPFLLPKYIDSLTYFGILSIYGFLQCLYFLVCNYLFYYNNTKTLMYITFGCSIIHMLMSLFLTRYSLVCVCFIYIFTQSMVVFLVSKKSWFLLKKNSIV